MNSAATTEFRPAMLQRSDLHASLADRALEAVNFLNEVIDRFPKAISFAPGAPNPQFFDDLDVGEYIDRYAAHLTQEHGLTLAQVRRRLYQMAPAAARFATSSPMLCVSTKASRSRREPW